MIVSDQGATDRPSNVLRVAALLEQASRQAQTGQTETLFLEVGAVDLQARLVRLGTGVLVVTSDILVLRHVPSRLSEILEQVGEVGTVGVADAATRNVDFGEREQTVTSLGLHEVVDGLGRGAPATGGDQRTTGQTRLIDRVAHGDIDRIVRVICDSHVRAVVAADRGNAHLLTDMTASTTGGIER